MAIFKCKMCGGSLEIAAGASVIECEYCGTQQTLPKLEDERRTNLFNRATHFRRNNEFDKAMSIYESILNEDGSDAEAYWSLVLCRYGIEYVEDPTSHKRIPTVNRAQFTSIFDDDNYKSALQHADSLQKAVYEAEAKAINEIQKGILAISQKEEPFDVFICYKESDSNGSRTHDSVLANDLYHQLTQEGFKVFFSRITLEDKLGTAYEPYIFAALNSAKVMVVIGTKPEYFNAVWVKNEWSRYLTLVKQSGGKKILIPAYRDMDPYDLPEEFSHLQAQDMSKLGFMQDLIRGIKKIAQADAPAPAATTVVKETVVTGGASNIEPLLKRVFMFLEDSDWKSANEYCEKVLDIDPENASAYLGKLMALLRVRKQDDLKDYANPFDQNSNYQKIMRFGDNELKTALEGYIAHINTRNENARLESIYSSAKDELANAKAEKNCLDAANLFKSIAGYKDSSKLIDECKTKAETLRKDAIYEQARKQMNDGSVASWKSAIELFESIHGWKDADKLAQDCRDNIVKHKAKLETERLEAERLAKIAQEEAVRQKKLNTRIAIIASSAVAFFVAVGILLTLIIIPTIKYNKADSLLNAGEYESAMEGFRELNFKDSYEKYGIAFSSLKENFQKTADQYLASGDNINAAIYYTKAGMPIKAKEVFDFASILRAGEFITAGISTDGKVYYQTNHEGDRYSPYAIQDMVRFLPDVGGFTGLTKTGELITHDLSYDEDIRLSNKGKETALNELTGVVDFYDDYGNWYALMSDGTIDRYIGEPDSEIEGTYLWKNIVSIYRFHSGFNSGLIGIDRDGHVLIAYEKGTTESEKFSTDSWVGIQKVCKINGMLIGITSDNTLKVAYNASEKIKLGEAVLNYTDVVDVVHSSPYLAILHKDGTVSMELVGSFSSTEEYAEQQKTFYKEIVDKITTWDGIVALYHGGGGFIGIRYDGTVKYVSNNIVYLSGSKEMSYKRNEHIKNKVESWTNIVWVDSSRYSKYSTTYDYVVGLKADGTVTSTGDGTYYVTEKSTYGDGYYAKSCSGGTYHNVSSWKLW